MADDDRISPIGRRQQNAAQNPYPPPSKPAALQPDNGSVSHTAAAERQFYENYMERIRDRRQ
jgi:hypothetical protein